MVSIIIGRIIFWESYISRTQLNLRGEICFPSTNSDTNLCATQRNNNFYLSPKLETEVLKYSKFFDFFFQIQRKRTSF